ALSVDIRARLYPLADLAGGGAMPGAGFEPAGLLRAADFKSADLPVCLPGPADRIAARPEKTAGASRSAPPPAHDRRFVHPSNALGPPGSGIERGRSRACGPGSMGHPGSCASTSSAPATVLAPRNFGVGTVS